MADYCSSQRECAATSQVSEHGTIVSQLSRAEGRGVSAHLESCSFPARRKPVPSVGAGSDAEFMLEQPIEERKLVETVYEGNGADWFAGVAQAWQTAWSQAIFPVTVAGPGVKKFPGPGTAWPPATNSSSAIGGVETKVLYFEFPRVERRTSLCYGASAARKPPGISNLFQP